MKRPELFAILRNGSARGGVGRENMSLSHLWYAKCLLTVLLLFVSLHSSATAEEIRQAIPLKAAFITKFVEFTDWPAEATPGQSAPIRIGVLGNDPMADELKKALNGANFKGHSFQLVIGAEITQLSQCQIIFISPAEMPRLGGILGQIKAKPFLTVGDVPGFCTRGGMINFIEKDNKIRFEINVEAVHRAGLRINSKLLKVSVLVTEEKQP